MINESMCWQMSNIIENVVSDPQAWNCEKVIHIDIVHCSVDPGWYSIVGIVCRNA